MFYRLIDQVGYRWSVRILGFTSLATLVLPIIVLKQRVKPSKARALFDLTAVKDVPYMIFSIGTMVGFTGLYVMFFYLSYSGLARGITNDSLSFYLVPILNAGSVFGRTLPNWLSDKIGPFNVIFPGALICSVLVLCMLAVHTVGGIVVIALFFGFFSGIFIALPPVLFVALTEDKTKVGTRIGMGFAIISPAVFLGGPAAGAILDSTRSQNWTGIWVYAGITLMAASFSFLFIRFSKTGMKLKVKI